MAAGVGGRKQIVTALLFFGGAPSLQCWQCSWNKRRRWIERGFDAKMSHLQLEIYVAGGKGCLRESLYLFRDAPLSRCPVDRGLPPWIRGQLSESVALCNINCFNTDEIHRFKYFSVLMMKSLQCMFWMVRRHGWCKRSKRPR